VKLRIKGLTFFPPLDMTVTVHVPVSANAVMVESWIEQLSLLIVGVSPERKVAWKGTA